MKRIRLLKLFDKAFPCREAILHSSSEHDMLLHYIHRPTHVNSYLQPHSSDEHRLPNHIKQIRKSQKPCTWREK